AAEAVASEGGDAPAVVGEGIASLVAKSLVTRDGSTPAGRWRLLETIRAYALEKLSESGEANETARRHAEFFRKLIVPAATSEVLRISVDDVARFGREIDNVRKPNQRRSGSQRSRSVLVTMPSFFWPNILWAQRCYSRVGRIKRGIALNAWLNTTFRRRAGGTKSCFNMTSAWWPERDWHVRFVCKVILIRPKSRPR